MVPGSETDRRDALLVLLVRAVREIQARDVHTGAH
jgi:hypothetical protein